jgi:Trk K+ transport system NAD-binding subunit
VSDPHAPSPNAPSPRERAAPRVLMVGSDHLAFRILEQLRHDGCDITLVALEGSWLSSIALPAGVRAISGSIEAPEFLEAAGLETAEILFVVTDRDELNLGVALAALEVNSSLRVVLRQFNTRLGRLVAKDLPQCHVLSMSALSATTFALAALTPGVVFAHDFGKQTLVLREVSSEDGAERSGSHRPAGAPAPMVVAAWSEGRVTWFPTGAEPMPGARLLVAGGEQGLPPYPRVGAPARAARRGPVDWRHHRLLIWVLGYIAFVILAGATYFAVRLGMSPLDAVYFVITIITSVGFGDFSLREADALSKLVGMAIMVSGVMMTAVLFAFVTNSLIARQHALDHGQTTLRLEDHVVVCGLGVIGFRVAQALRRMGEAVVVIEADEAGRFVAAARGEGIPVVAGDALQEKSLLYANAARAKALVVCTNPDYMNLEIALHVRSLFPNLPIVLRLFDPDLSRRVAKSFHLETTFSSAALVAFRFAAFATDPTKLARLRFHGADFEVRQTAASGETVGFCCRRSGGRAIAVVDRRGELRFAPRDDERVGEGETLILVVFEDEG